MAISFNKNGETKSIATYNSCITNITVSDPNSWGNTYTASNGSVNLTVPSNSTSSNRNETITISYYAGNTSCSKTIDISQDGGSPTPTACSNGVTVGLGGTCVSAQASSTPIKLGTWSKTPSDCANSWSIDTSRSISGTTFISPTSLDFRSNGDIYGVVSDTNTTSSTRECKIPTILGSITDYFTVTQCAGSTPPTPTTCDCSTFSVNGSSQSVSSAASSTEYTLAVYTTAYECTQPLVITRQSGENFISDIRYANGSIYGKVSSTNTGAARQATYSVVQASCSGTFVVNQAAGTPPVQDVFKWKVSGHEYHYDTNVLGAATYFSPEMFDSILNGSSVNGVMTSNVSWITVNSPMYINNNELRPNLNNTVYLTPNTTDQSRGGTLTLTQKGGTSTITVTITQGAYVPDCTITAFTMNNEACKDSGGRLNYTFDVADTRCTQNFNFTLYDSNGTAIQSSASPSSGHGSGYFNIANAHLGNATCVVTVNGTSTTYTCNIKMCNFAATFQITNGLSEEACVDKIDIVTNGGTITLSDMGECLRPGSTTRFVHDLSHTLSGTAFSSIILRDTLVRNKTYSTNYGSGTLEETTYPITIQSELTRNLLLESNEEETEENNEEEIENTNESE